MEALLKLVTIANLHCSSYFWPSDRRECEDRVILCLKTLGSTNDTDAVINCVLKNKRKSESGS